MEYTKPEIVRVATPLSAVQNTGLFKGYGGMFDCRPDTTAFNTLFAYQADE